MNQRRPRTALRSSALPNLAALLASGIAVEGCATNDGSTARGDRLSTHGHNASRALGNGQVGDALREIGIGLGLLDEVVPPITVAPAGAMPVVNPQPPPNPPEPPIAPSGAVAPVNPQPPPQPPVPPVHPSGGPMMVNPDPPHAPPRPLPSIGGARAPVSPHPPTGPSSSPR